MADEPFTEIDGWTDPAINLFPGKETWRGYTFFELKNKEGNQDGAGQVPHYKMWGKMVLHHMCRQLRKRLDLLRLRAQLQRRRLLPLRALLRLLLLVLRCAGATAVETLLRGAE